MVFYQHPYTALLPRRVLAPVTSSEEMGEDGIRDSTVTERNFGRDKL
jgi:hypothetical protein